MDLTSEIPRDLESQDLKETIVLFAFVNVRGVTASYPRIGVFVSTQLYAVFSTSVQSWCCRGQSGCSLGAHLQFPLQIPTTVDYRWVYLGCSIIINKKLTKLIDNKTFLYPNFGSRSLDNLYKYIPERFLLGVAANLLLT